jgi:signal transduction histidine kinase
MTAFELLNFANQVLFIGLFGASLWHALRHPSRAAWDTTLLFGSIASVIVVSRAAAFFGLGESPIVVGIVLLGLIVSPYAMVRLVDDFSSTPRWLLLATAPGVAVLGVLGFLAFDTSPQVTELAIIAWFLGVGGYAALAFGRAAVSTRGITRNRMTAVTIGAVFYVAAIVIVFADLVVETVDLTALPQLLAFFAAIAFFLGFAPPAWIRRAWREPDLRAFLESSVRLTTMHDERRAVAEIERAAASAFGASGSSIGLAVEGKPILRYLSRTSRDWVDYPSDAYIGGQSFTEQRRIVAMNAGRSDPDHAEVYRKNEANTVIAAPITSDDRRLGVLTVYADRAPIFVEDDLWLLELLASHTAILLEARKLGEVEAELRAREDSAKLKEEFLSAAAHDLRTPLTVVLGQAELLERRHARDPSAPPDAAGVQRIVREARRLRDLVSQILDAQRLEQGATVMERAPVDLRAVVDSVRRRFHDQGLDLKVTAPADTVLASIDAPRFEQVVDNLVENAVKYTRSGVLPEVELRTEAGEAHIRVTDRGVGVPAEERERIFDRFYRATNVQGTSDTGIGLGLYICRRIVEAHDGRIWVSDADGGGSVFTVALPQVPEPAQEAVDEATAPGWAGPTAEARADA